MQQIYRRTPIPKCDFNKVEIVSIVLFFYNNRKLILVIEKYVSLTILYWKVTECLSYPYL